MAQFSKIIAVGLVLASLVACQTKKNDGSAASSSQNQQASAATAGSKADFDTNVGDRVFFAYDSSTLTAEAQAVATRQAEWLKKYPNVKFTVEGHCDERGTREYNQALGDRRAHEHKKFLVASGVDASRVETVSFGKDRPAVQGTGDESYAQNRRGVIVLKDVAAQ
jgi:peptidoglycan-associated lipoprotein